jgi:DNA-binding winged helix-turn-helix (wHTH) protein
VPSPRYRFGDFVLSPRLRVLVRNGREQPLIPRYFDLLLFLIARRGEAVHRRDIFDAVWPDVVVSDSALSQAIRTIRRVLGDDSREPTFVRTVSRHGYQFVFSDIVEEEDPGEWPVADVAQAPLRTTSAAPGDPFTPLIAQITRTPVGAVEEEEQREAAERLHALGTAETLTRLRDATTGASFARALLRDTRWDAHGAGDVPIAGEADGARVVWELVRLRWRRAVGMAARRWAAASIGGGTAGGLGGAAGCALLALVPGGSAPLAVIPVLSAIGAACGGLAGAGVGAGLAVAELVIRSRRTIGLVMGGAAGGGLVGVAIQMLGRWTLAVLIGIAPPIGGAFEGVAIGAAAGLGYGLATGQLRGGLAAPRGPARVRVAIVTGGMCALAALALSLLGRPLAGGTIHAIAQASVGSQAVLTPLGRLIGEPGFGPVTSALIGMGEGASFGLGLAVGLTRRP